MANKNVRLDTNYKFTGKGGGGSVNVGGGLDVTPDGKVEVSTGEGLDINNINNKIEVKVDNSSITINEGNQITINEVPPSALPIATSETLGGIKVGDNLTITEDGKLSATGGGGGYVLPPATATRLGGIKVGENLTITTDGTLSATGGGGSYELPTATQSRLGGVKVGSGLQVEDDGTLSTTGALQGATIREHTDFATFLFDTSKSEYYINEAPVKRQDVFTQGKKFIVQNPVGADDGGELEIWGNGNKSDCIMGDFDYYINRDDDGNIITDDGELLENIDNTYTIDAERQEIYKDGSVVMSNVDIYHNLSAGPVRTEKHNNLTTGTNIQTYGTNNIVTGTGNFVKNANNNLISGHNIFAVGSRNNDTTDINNNLISGENTLILNTTNSIISMYDVNKESFNWNIRGIANTHNSIVSGEANSYVLENSLGIGAFNGTSVIFKGNEEQEYKYTAERTGENTFANGIILGTNNSLDTAIDSHELSEENKTKAINTIFMGEKNTIRTKGEAFKNSIFSGSTNGVGGKWGTGINAPNLSVNNSIISSVDLEIVGENEDDEKKTIIEQSLLLGNRTYIGTHEEAEQSTVLKNSVVLGYNNAIETNAQIENCVVAGDRQRITGDTYNNAVWLSGTDGETNVIIDKYGTIKAKNVIVDGVGVNQTVKVKSILITTEQLTEADESMPYATHKFDLPDDCLNVLSIAKNANSNVNYSITDIDTENRVCGFRMFDNTDIIVSYSYK